MTSFWLKRTCFGFPPTTVFAGQFTSGRRKSMRLGKYLLLSVLFVLGLMLSAQASTLGNGPPDGNGAADLNSFLEADNFTTSVGSSTITGINFWERFPGQSIAITAALRVLWCIPATQRRRAPQQETLRSASMSISILST
jgi:hypothetical protein